MYLHACNSTLNYYFIVKILPVDGASTRLKNIDYYIASDEKSRDDNEFMILLIST